MKAKYILIAAVTIILLFASIALLPMENRRASTADAKVYWEEVAENAWKYFQPGTGVDPRTGLHGAVIDWPYFTDWDIGTYIQTVIDMEKLGILSRDGVWGADARIEKLVSFLENRELNNDDLPYWWYEAATGQKYGDGPPNVADTGRLLVALHNLRLYRPELAARINNVVYERTNYEQLWPSVDLLSGSTSIYDYYVASGFAGFWPARFSPVAETILSNIVSAPTVETHGVKLPLSKMLCEPILLSMFELKPDDRLQEIAKQVYLAHEARYNATGKFVAFSEGNTGLDEISYTYEWVVLSDGRTWVIRDSLDSDVSISEIIYLKVAMGFLAIYNSEFAQNMNGYLTAHLPQPGSGYMDGIDEDGRVVSRITDKTNGLIISAARYALENINRTISARQNSDLGVFPWPFVQSGVASNTTIVVGESKPHGPVGAAQTVDNLGGIFIAEKLGRESSSGTLRAAIDNQLVSYDANSGSVTLLDNTTNLIVVGNPGINLVSYFYNNFRDSLGKPFLPVVFLVNSTASYSYLYVPTSSSVYRTESAGHDGQVTDYGVVMIFQDQFGRHVVMVYGLGAEGTLAASEVLRNYDQWDLHGSAVILKCYTDTAANTRNVSIVEVVP